MSPSFADLHAITVTQVPEDLHANTRELVALYIPSGVDSSKNTIYIQSENLYHPVLSWILECHTPYGELSRMTQFKDKRSRNENFSAGLLTYPVLMEADIILYDVDYVPVGADQTQHVEFARDIARRFNNKYGETFKVPAALIASDVERIMNLQNPEKKMSKSADNKNGVIFLLDDVDTIARKIKRAVTDSAGTIDYAPESRPGVSNLVSLFAGLSDQSIDDVVGQFEGMQYGRFKSELADLAVSVIYPIQKRYYELIDSPELDRYLDEGRNRTLEIAKRKYEEVSRKVGYFR